MDVKSLLDTAEDCLRFVAEFFEVIGQSAPHIYHSTILLAPQSSIVQKLYHQQINSLAARVVTGIPTSWDACTATFGTTTEVNHAVWSPCSQFVAVIMADNVELRNPTTLERMSILKPPSSHMGMTPKFFAFSPDGSLLACIYWKHHWFVILSLVCVHANIYT